MSSMRYNLDPMFNPKTVAVIGASRNPQSVGHACLRNLLSAKFPGKIFPVNPKADKLLGLKVLKSTADIPQDVDLAVIAIPSRFIPNTIEQCGQRGVKSLIVISAGFKETGEEGAKLEHRVVEIAKKYDMPLLGPNVLGLLNVPAHLNASFGPNTPEPGHIGFISQSGALGSGILDWAVIQKVGFSKFVSIGNKAMLNEVDIIEYLGEDPETKVILVYIESIADGRRFLDVARKVTKKKPVIIIKGGRSEEGAKAASSHTGSLAGQFVAYETAFKQTGVLFAKTAQQLFDFAYAFQSQPIPATRQTAIVTNAGGPGILAADALAEKKLKLARFQSETIERLVEVLPATANFYDPVDVIGDAGADRYEAAMDIVMTDPNVDNLLVLLTMQAMTQPVETAKAIVKIAKKYPGKPVVTCFMGGADINSANELFRENDIPFFDFPFRAVDALWALNKFGEYSRKPQQEPPDLADIDRDTVRKIIENARKDERLTLLADETTEVIGAYGINTAKTILAKTGEEAVAAAKELGYPVVLKIASPQIIHKTDIGGVKLNLKTAKDVKTAFNEIMDNARKFGAGAKLYGVTVQYMSPKGRELIIGMSRDIQFGPLMMFGLGGIFVNFLKDVSFRLAPLTQEDAELMIEETKASTLLKGVRGELPSDIPAIVNTLIRIGLLVTDFPEILEMDINPLFAFTKGSGVTAIDVKITLAPPEKKSKQI
ncbi:MAG: acetate--CoA ligase alpha subunit [Candidatus Ranarchaeia archaeon]